jgi:hypothetical protein
LSKYNVARELGKAARAFADDLATNRLANILKDSARKLERQLDSEDVRRLGDELPQLRSALAALRRWVAPLQAERVHSPEGVRAALALAQLLYKLDRFAEASMVLRETLVTQFALDDGMSVPEPGEDGCLDAREEAERRLGELSVSQRRSKAPKSPEDVRSSQTQPQSERTRTMASLFSRLGELRNDISHCGLNNAPGEGSRLKNNVREYLKDTRALLDTPSPHASVTDEATAGCFVNLSNHPVSTWPEAQRQAAEALGLGEVCELEGGMPQVDPDADTNEVERLAEELAQRALAQGARGAHVAGEAGLTVALVSRLQARGVRCFSATTDRNAEMRTENGEWVKTSVFRFRRWREYPDIGH